MNSLIPPDRPLPSTTAVAIATAIIAGVGGYFIGQASSIGLFSSSNTPAASKSNKPPKESWPNSYDVTIHPDSSDEELMTHLQGGKGKGEDGRTKEVADSEDDGSSEDEDEDAVAVGDLSEFKGNTEECKLVLCVRTDLGMGKGMKKKTTSFLGCVRFSPSAPRSPHRPLTASSSNLTNR